MKNILYIDCFSGISGDMMAGALLDIGYKGIDLGYFKKELAKIELGGYRIETEKVKRGPVFATKFNVFVETPQPSRNFNRIAGLISGSGLDDEVKKLSLDMFSVIADAEASVHGTTSDQVHFHEVGAVDSIIDIVCVSLAIQRLSPVIIYCSHIPLGTGIAKTMHGGIPVPAPATLEILKGIPVYGGGFDFEVTTPTGAAVIKVLADAFDDVPEMIIELTGNGAGSYSSSPGHEHGHTKHHKTTVPFENSENKNSKNKNSEIDSNNRTLPDVLRLMFGKTTSSIYPASFLMVSTNIDDSSSEIIGYVQEKLWKSGALDCWSEPIFMKKNRPAFKICVLCKNEDLDKILEVIFIETSSLGVRVEKNTRYCLDREIKTVRLPYGEAKVKIGIFKGMKVTYSPEYESCRELAEKTKKPLKEIYGDLGLFLSSK